MTEKTTIDEKEAEDLSYEVEEEELDNSGTSSDSPSDSCEWVEPDDDDLIVIETGDGAPLVSTVETAESYYFVNSHQHSFNELSASGNVK